jgi:aspartyl-tRNA(Asn)/glutamyl-tRNA(Gln) amidotransferase subunit A
MPALERIERQLDAIDRLNPSLRALITVRDRAEILAQAQARMRDETEALRGMTIALKDNIDTAGIATTGGAAFMRDRVPGKDATVVTRLLGAGAIVIGKANLTELAFGIHSRSAIAGQCRNPWDPERIPGGSSGGAAVSIAVGFCDGALGTDTGGSVRMPAAMTGVAGLRPTFGVVPATGTLPVSEAHDVVGPMARRVADVARLFTVIAGHDPEDPRSSPAPIPDVLGGLGGGIRGLRIGVPANHYLDGCSHAVATRVQAALRALEQAGARLIDIRIPGAEETQEMLTRRIFADACRHHGDRLRNAPDTISADIRERMLRGLDYSAVDLAEALQFRQRWRQTLRLVFSDVEIIAAPTVPVVAPPIRDDRSLFEATRAVARNTFAAALAGIPSLSVPCGFSDDGLPVGLLLDAAWHREDLLLRAGHAYQEITDFHRCRPPGAADGDRGAGD